MVVGFLEKTTEIRYAVKGAAPGKAVLVKTLAAGGQARETEMYHPPGESSAPTKNDRVVSIPVGTGTRIIIASHNYRIEINPNAGEKIIYSTNQAGDTVKAKIKLDNDGQIILNDGTDYAVAYTDLSSALQAFITDLNTKLVTALTAAGSTWPGTSLNISGSKIDKVRMP